MVPCSIGRVMDLPPNAKLMELQQYTHGAVLLIRAATHMFLNKPPCLSPTQGATQFVDCESISPTQRATKFCGL